MPEIDRILDQHARAFDGNAWHGPAVFELLKGLGARPAAARPIGGGHTIWEIVLHIATWEEVAARRLAGERFDPSPEQDWPPPGATDEKSWASAVALLAQRHRDLQRAIAAIPDARLDERVPGQAYSMYVLAHGAVQHAIYHAGQIALLKKAPLG